MMKKSYALFLLLVILGNKAIAQNVGINTTGAAPNASAMLDIDASNKGLLIPRVALTSTTSNAPIGAGIANSLLVYNTATAGTAPNNVTPGYYYWNGTRWVRLLDNTGNNGTAWLTTGNAGTTASTNFLGTTDNVDLVFRTNNTEKMRILSNGNVGIGTTAPGSLLQIHGSGGDTKGIRLTSTGTNGPATYIYPGTASPDAGFITFGDGTGWKFHIGKRSDAGATKFVTIQDNGDVGIGTTSPLELLYVGSLATPANIGLTLSNSAGSLRWYNSSGTLQNALRSLANADMQFVTNGSERMRITSTGNVGIGTTTPGTKLDVIGNIRLSGTHFIYNSSNGVINWGSAGNGNLYFRTLSTQGDPSSAYTDRMIILNNGNVGIGTTTPITKLHVAGTHPGAGFGNGSNSDAPSQAIIPAGSNGTSRYNDWPNSWGGGISTWDIVGASTYFSYYTTRSDKRFKHDIHSLSETKNDFINKFMQLHPVSYFINPKTLPIDDPERKRFGFIANEIETIFPNLVINAGMPDSIARGLEYDGFIPILVMMTQDHQLQINEQQNKINELNTKNQDLVKTIEDLKAELDKLTTVNEQLTTQNSELKSRIERIEQILGTMAKNQVNRQLE